MKKKLYENSQSMYLVYLFVYEVRGIWDQKCIWDDSWRKKLVILGWNFEKAVVKSTGQQQSETKTKNLHFSEICIQESVVYK